jgi:hypothetical protein
MSRDKESRHKVFEGKIWSEITSTEGLGLSWAIFEETPPQVLYEERIKEAPAHPSAKFVSENAYQS